MMNSDLCILTFNPETKTRLGTCHPRYSQPYIYLLLLQYYPDNIIWANIWANTVVENINLLRQIFIFLIIII